MGAGLGWVPGQVQGGSSADPGRVQCGSRVGRAGPVRIQGRFRRSRAGPVRIQGRFRRSRAGPVRIQGRFGRIQGGSRAGPGQVQCGSGGLFYSIKNFPFCQMNNKKWLKIIG